MGSPEARAVERAKDRLALSMRRYSGQNEVFRTLNRYYLSLSPKLRGADNDRPFNTRARSSPNLFVPRFFTAVQGAMPPWLFATLGEPPRFYGRKPGYEDAADATTKMLKYDWDRSQVLYRSMHVASQMFKYGTGIAKVDYRYDAYELARKYERTIPYGFRQSGNGDEPAWKRLLMRTDRIKQKETVVRFDGPWLSPVSVYNFFPDPYYADLCDMRYAAWRRWTDRETLKLENENHERLTGKPLYKHLDRIPRVKRGYVEEIYQTDHEDDLSEAMGWSGAGSFSVGRAAYSNYLGRTDADEMQDLVEVYELWERDDHVTYIANGETPIYDGENFFDDKELPFVATRCHVMDGQFWGYGILHPILKLQEELNAHRNLMMRQAQFNTLNMWGYEEHIGIPQEILQAEPGKMVPIPFFNEHPLLVPLMQGRPLPPEAYNMEDRMDRDIMIAIAQGPDYRSGTGGRGKTATEAEINRSNADARNRVMALGGEITYAIEIAKKFHARRQQFLRDEGEVFRILGEDGTEYVQMTPETIAKEYDIVAAGNNLYASRDVLRQQWLQLLALIKGDPVYLELVKLPESMEETLKMFDIQHPKRFLNKPKYRTYDQNVENLVMQQGEPVAVEPKDDHEFHLESHREAYQQIEVLDDPRARKAFEKHIKEHEGYLRQAQSQAPPQEQPGLRGYAGNVPNLENAVESQAGLAARVGGAGRQV